MVGKIKQHAVLLARIELFALLLLLFTLIVRARDILRVLRLLMAKSVELDLAAILGFEPGRANVV